MFRFDGADLNAQNLHRQAMRNIRLILVLGGILILADLALSFAGQSVPLLRDGDRLYLLRPAAGEDAGHVSLDAVVRSDGKTVSHRFSIRLDPQQKQKDEAPADTPEAARDSSEDLIRSELRSMAAGFNEDLSARRIPLPMSLDSGEAIAWRRVRTTNTLLLAALTGASAFLLYRNRLRPLRKLEQAQQRSVLQQLPSFINEIVLLLNAGLVLSRAFEMTVERSSGAEETKDYFWENIRRIYHAVKHTNGALQEELQRFARDCGVSELLRVSGIISDNISKGAALNEKLERESESLWLSRKRHAEQQGRLAETKMSIPLAIFLCVLIIITVSPALLQL